MRYNKTKLTPRATVPENDQVTVQGQKVLIPVDLIVQNSQTQNFSQSSFYAQLNSWLV